MVERFSFEGHMWVPLSQYEKIGQLATALNDERIQQWLCKNNEDVEEVLARRVEQERTADGVTLVIEQEQRAIGFAGLIRYLGREDAFQTTTYLTPEVWGTGLAPFCRQMQASLAHVLEIPEYYASVHIDNNHSWKSLSRHFPKHTYSTEHEPWIPRDARVMRLTSERIDSDMSDDTIAELRKMVQGLPLAKRLMDQTLST